MDKQAFAKHIKIITKQMHIILQNCPRDSERIQLHGDLYFSYLYLHPNINPKNIVYTDLQSYYDEVNQDADTDFANSPIKKRITDHCCMWNEFWEENDEFIDGSITIDLSRFSNLKHFSTSYLYIDRIINIPDGLDTLHCTSCQLSSLDKLPNSLTRFNCSSNVMSSLPDLYYTKIKSLFCSNNKLTSIPRIPNTL